MCTEPRENLGKLPNNELQSPEDGAWKWIDISENFWVFFPSLFVLVAIQHITGEKFSLTPPPPR